VVGNSGAAPHRAVVDEDLSGFAPTGYLGATSLYVSAFESKMF
jgi:hypothetical protein